MLCQHMHSASACWKVEPTDITVVAREAGYGIKDFKPGYRYGNFELHDFSDLGYGSSGEIESIVDEPVRARYFKPFKLVDPGALSLRLAIKQAGSSNRKNGSDKGKSGSGNGFDFGIDVEPVEVKLFPGLGCNGPGVL